METVTQTVWTPAERQAWSIPPPVTVSQWAEANRIIVERTSAEPGPWRNDRTPYLVGIMDAFGDEDVEEITLMLPPQFGKSAAMQNMQGYIIDRDPGPALQVLPTDDDCADNAKNLLKPMCMASDALRRHLTGREYDLNSGSFYFDRMTFYFRGSNSTAGLGRIAIRYLFMDEEDKYPPYVGKETNPDSLAKKRTTTFPWDRKIVRCSTPTLETGLINLAWLRSNMQEYYVPCAHCGEFGTWIFGNLKIPESVRDPEEILKCGEIYYLCPVCEYKIYEEAKPQCVAGGRWVPEGQKIKPDGTITGKPKRGKRHSGFHAECLISPWVSWGEVMSDWFAANMPEGIALQLLKDFRNARQALPWEEQGIQIETSKLAAKRGDFSQATVPSDCKVLVAGADYHKSENDVVRIDYTVKGFGYGYRNRTISSGSVDSFDKLVDAVLMEPFPWSDPDKKEETLAVVRIFIDSGYKPDDVCDFCRMYPGIAFPTKGTDNQRTPLAISRQDKDPPEIKARYRGLLLYLVDTTYFKNQVTSWADAEPTEPRSTVYYAEVPDRYFTEFANEKRVKVRDKKTGIEKMVWRPVAAGRPTHALDIEVLAAAAAHSIKVYLLRPEKADGGAERKIPAAITRMMEKRDRPAKQRRPADDQDDYEIPELDL